MKNIPIVILVTVLALFASCTPKEGTKEAFELITASNGLLYRINKQSGEVSLVVGAQITKIEEPKSGDKADGKKNRVITWPDVENKQLGNLKLQMKTTWRDGKMYYIYQVSPYAGRIEKEQQKSDSTARFVLRFYDSDAFEVFTVPIKLSEMVQTVGDTGKIGSLTLNTSVMCSLETYEALKLWSVGWGGFEEASAQ